MGSLFPNLYYSLLPRASPWRRDLSVSTLHFPSITFMSKWSLTLIMVAALIGHFYCEVKLATP